nr:MAG TPA: hypothetical protein [Caudoviricetes sp.]
MESELAYILSSDASDKEKVHALIGMLKVGLVEEVSEVVMKFKEVYDSSINYETVGTLRPEDSLKNIRSHLLETINKMENDIDNYIKDNNIKVQK